MTDLIYKYPPLLPGILVKRYKRFFADIELASGEIITAHCPNTGPMTGVCIPGNPVLVSSSNNPKRKLAYTWELIKLCDTEPTWVGVNTGLPNRIIKLALELKLFPELGDYSLIQPEVVFGTDKKSRVDFWLSDGEKSIFVEVKNTTWAKDKLALFPDTVTERGQKHLRELIEVVRQGDSLRDSFASRAVMLYFINRGDCTDFAPGDSADRAYGVLFRQAISAGVEILPCRFDVTPEGIRYLGLAGLAV